MRGQYHKEPAQQITMDRVGHFLRSRTLPDPWDINEPPPQSNLYPSLQDLEDFYTDTLAGPWDFLSHDLENAGPHVICDGMTQLCVDTGQVGQNICLRFRAKGGELWWSEPRQHLAATKWLADVLYDERVGKVFHNGVTHDVPILEELGFEVRGRLMDTMILMHTAYSEFQKGLQYCATFWNFSPVWKTLVQETEEEEGKG